MTDTPKDTPRVLTEDEAYAIVADRVQRETADRDSKIATLESEKSALANEVDLKVAALTAETARADAAEKALADYKAEIEAEKAAAERTEARVATVREIKGLKDDFITPERASRWAQMDDDTFSGYCRELAEILSVAVTTPAGEPPRETAMAGAGVQEKKNTGNLKSFLGGVN